MKKYTDRKRNALYVKYMDYEDYRTIGSSIILMFRMPPKTEGWSEIWNFELLIRAAEGEL